MTDIKQYEHCDFINDSDNEEFLNLLEKVVTTENPELQFELGYYYYNGDISETDEDEVSDEDYSKAVFWWVKAAEQGHKSAQNNLGICYLHGRGVERNRAKAVYWYTQAAEQGHDNAQFVLGYCNFHGLEMKADPVKAVDFFIQAAEPEVVAASALSLRLSAHSRKVFGIWIFNFQSSF